MIRHLLANVERTPAPVPLKLSVRQTYDYPTCSTRVSVSFNPALPVEDLAVVIPDRTVHIFGVDQVLAALRAVVAHDGITVEVTA